jgi:hypothetical protein
MSRREGAWPAITSDMLRAGRAADQGSPLRSDRVLRTRLAPGLGVRSRRTPCAVSNVSGGSSARPTGAGLSDGRRVDVPINDVRRLDVEVRDSLTNGTLIGATAFGLWCALICGQGLDSGDDLPRALLANTALGAALGAFVDSRMSSRRVVYERPRQARRSRLPIAVPLVTLRF